MPSESKTEDVNNSRINLYNVSTVVEHIIWVVCEAKIARPEQINIVTPYAAQVGCYFDALRRVSIDKPDYAWQHIRVGTTEWFMRKEASYMVVNFVRATNNKGDLGFLS